MTCHRYGLALLLSVVAIAAVRAEGSSGEAIYRKQCASCHGAAGEGVKDKYPQPLTGDRSIPQLAKQIARTMPEDNPGTCVGDDAAKVAAYIHDTFYSEAARERNKKPRQELARLTVRQYRYAVADLIGSFRPTFRIDDRRGLKGEYYKGRRFRSNDRVLDRTDPEVGFDYGVNSPDPKLDAAEFSIKWTGSVLPRETGHYEFVVRTEHAAKLFVNDTNRPVIDAWVKSGSDTEYRGSVYLIGGRAYPVRLEYSKGKQGVDDSKKKAAPRSVKSSIKLMWKPPHGVLDVIPVRCLSPLEGPTEYAVETAFPPDDRSYGWERGTAVSKEWDRATTDAAIEVATYIVARADEWVGASVVTAQLGSGNPSEITFDGPKSAPDAQRSAKLKAFALKFAERAFRRPLSNGQKAIIEKQFADDAELGLKRAVLFVLKSPYFLYREVGSTGDQFDTAARLSFGLWDSISDKQLAEAAAAGKLNTPDQVRSQATRMLADPRATAKLQDYLTKWVKADQHTELAKDAKKFAGFDDTLASDLRASLDLFFADVLAAPGTDFRRLLTADALYMNSRLAKFYGADEPKDGGFAKVKFQADRRSGVLTHPYLLSAFAYTSETSPIHRGVFLARGMLGLTMRPPPDAVAPLPPSLHPNLNTRERVTVQTKANACMTCHGVINPLGFTLEHFDAVGRFREADNAKPIDATGGYVTRDGKQLTFGGVKDLATYLANSDEVHAAFAEQLFHHLVQQPVRAFGPDTLAGLRTRFVANSFDIKKLAADIMATTALTPRDRGPSIPETK